ncbi:MAG: hypothetical protein RIR00_754 [Pseudomonadota bacterium]|jgi:uncharacterized membrane protein
MNLPEHLLEDWIYWLAWLLWAPLFLRSVRRAAWQRLSDGSMTHFWLGSCVVLVLLWSMKAGVQPGLDLHLLGATVMALCFGPELAFIGLNLVLLGVCLNGSSHFFAFALNSLLLGGVGIGVSHGLLRLGKTFLPHHFFVYVFVNGFFGSALTVFCVGLVSSLVLAAGGAYGTEYLFSEYLPYFLLLGFSEAWLSGMVMTLTVVYRPQWVATFDDASYLANK